MSREEAYEQAAACYRRAGYDLEAARCYRLAGAHRRAAEIYESAGRHAEAAASFADAGLPELGAWLLAHQAGQPAEARALLARAGRDGSGAAPLPSGPWPAIVARVWVGRRRDQSRVLAAGTTYTIGSNPASDIVVSDPWVSPLHADVRTEGPAWVFTDTVSSSGSWVEGRRERVTLLEVPADHGVRLGSPDDGPLLRFEYATVSQDQVPRGWDEWLAGRGQSSLRDRLVFARCEIAEGESADTIRPVIADVCAALANKSARSDQVTEEWAVALSEAAARYDQAALVFAAAVRGGRYGAAQRWQAWSVRVLGTEIILPPATAA